MSKAKEFQNIIETAYYAGGKPDKRLSYNTKSMNHKTLEDVRDVIHNNYTEEWSDEVGLYIDKILEGIQTIKL